MKTILNAKSEGKSIRYRIIKKMGAVPVSPYSKEKRDCPLFLVDRV
jgi:hypothetical protein